VIRRGRPRARPTPDVVRAAVAGVLTLVGLVVFLWLAFLLRAYLAVFLLGVVIGTALGPLVDRLARYRIPRLVSGFLVYALIAGVFSLFLLYAVPQMVDEGEQLIDRIDELERIYNDFADIGPLPPWDELAPLVQERLRDAAGQLAGQVASQAGAVLNAIVYTLTVFVVGLFWTLSRHNARGLFLSLLDPGHRAVADRTLATLGSRLRHYVLAEFAGMLAIGILVYIGLRLLGVPFAFVLAALAFFLEILPILGPWLAFIPALLVAIGEGWVTALLVTGFYLALQQVESYVIVPYFHGHGTGLPQLLVLYAILMGGALMGILGALVAIPVAVVLHTLFMEVFVPWRRAQVAASSEPAPAPAGD
jgi:predicted PurR-regulated permease PerM